MAEGRQKDLLSRLAEAGEDAIQRLGEAPGAHRLAEVANSMRDRVDELQRRVRGLDELQERVAELEDRVAALEGKPASLGGATAPGAAVGAEPPAEVSADDVRASEGDG